MTKVIKRIEKELGIEGIVSLLSGKLTPTDLQSLMLEVYQQNAKSKRPSHVLADYQNNRFVKPSTVSSSELLKLEQIFLEELDDDFETIELSPVCPLGTVSVLADLNQNKAVSTSRNTEVISDATNVLALECALRRKDLNKRKTAKYQNVHLAARHRFLRPQLYDNPAFLQHFQMFSLASAGRDQGNLSFELIALKSHLQCYLSSQQRTLKKLDSIAVKLTDFHSDDRTEYLRDGLLTPIQEEFEGVVCGFNHERETGRAYYRDLCFHICVVPESGEEVEIADGGAVDWTEKLLSDRKERLVISGIATERVVGLVS